VSAYNEIVLSADPELRVQFKYGRCWQYEYRVGDRISWDSLERPAGASGVVRIGGIAEVSGAATYRYFEITLNDDVIHSVIPISEERFEELEKLGRGAIP